MEEEHLETTAEIFARYQASATGHLRYVLVQSNLGRLHRLDHPLEVLDAAGGNGLNAEWLLGLGHEVTLLDTDAAMMAQAQTRLKGGGLAGRCTFVRGRVEEAGRLLPARRYRLILLHHILEYLPDPLAALRALHGTAAEGGELSLVTLNPVSEVIRAVVFRRDPTAALAKLSDLSFDAKWFGQARLFGLDQISAWAERAGWALRDFRGIRVLADYIPEEAYDQRRKEGVLRLEEALAGIEPYRRMGRYLQFCFRKA